MEFNQAALDKAIEVLNIHKKVAGSYKNHGKHETLHFDPDLTALHTKILSELYTMCAYGTGYDIGLIDLYRDLAEVLDKESYEEAKEIKKKIDLHVHCDTMRTLKLKERVVY